jgi:hypothetical protein
VLCNGVRMQSSARRHHSAAVAAQTHPDTGPIQLLVPKSRLSVMVWALRIIHYCTPWIVFRLVPLVGNHVVMLTILRHVRSCRSRIRSQTSSSPPPATAPTTTTAEISTSSTPPSSAAASVASTSSSVCAGVIWPGTLLHHR